jgi:hypothetical protein
MVRLAHLVQARPVGLGRQPHHHLEGLLQAALAGTDLLAQVGDIRRLVGMGQGVVLACSVMLGSLLRSG